MISIRKTGFGASMPIIRYFSSTLRPTALVGDPGVECPWGDRHQPATLPRSLADLHGHPLPTHLRLGYTGVKHIADANRSNMRDHPL
jgi:hypothetical protein